MISLIVAIANNNLIGNGNELPWYYPEDLQYFKKTTLNKTVLMGKKTFLSIVNRLNKPLPKRHNVVATFDKTFTYPNVEVVNNLDEYLKEKSISLIKNTLNKSRELLAMEAAKADALSPLSTLLRGYSIAESHGRSVNSVSAFEIGEEISVRFTDGSVFANVTEIRKEMDDCERN